ncbi:MAG: HAMP domain-containing protein [Dehalococcoidia bacterium]|nr:HAMP domain-containing protein [Dehalococcoidia bacterium]
MNVRSRITLLFVLLAIVPVVLVGFLAYYTGRQSIEQVEINHLVSTNLMKSSELTRWIEGYQQRMEELAQRPLLVQYSSTMVDFDPADPVYDLSRLALEEDHLKPRVKLMGGFTEVSVISPDKGIILASSDEMQEGKYYANQRFFAEGKTHTYTQGVFYSLPLQQTTMMVSTPINDRRELLVAVLSGRLDLRDLSTIMSAQSGLSQSEKTYLVNKSNFFVTEPYSGEGYALKKTVRTEGVQAGLSGKDGVAFYNDYRNVPVIGAYKWLPEYNMCLITEVDQSEAYAPINSMAMTMLSIVSLLALIVVAAGFFLARTITQPLARLVAGAAEIGRYGHLDRKVGTEDKDEIGELSRAFDRMAMELKMTTVSIDELELRIHERTAQLEAANRELEAFSYSVSHDLRAPLRAIDGYTRILLEDYRPLLDDEGKRICSVISEGAHKMSDLIDDLLTFSRLGRSALNPSNIDMEAMARAVFQELTTGQSLKRIDFELDSAPPAMGDPALLRQVWANLLSNSIKFSQKKKRAVIKVRGERSEIETVYSVQDNGVGFDMQYVNKLFGVFQRLHSVKDFEGNGVGLALVQRVIHRHGGRVWAEGETGKGATFYFTLPNQGVI